MKPMRNILACACLGLVLMPSFALGMQKHICGEEVKTLSVLAVDASHDPCCPQKATMPEGCCENEYLLWDEMATQELSWTTAPTQVLCLGLPYADRVAAYAEVTLVSSAEKYTLPPPRQGRHVLLRKGVLLL